MSIPTLQALAASRISPKTKKNIRSPLLKEANKQIDPAIKIQRTFRKKPTRINRKPELMTESTMRKQIYEHFKNDYEKFVNLLYKRLQNEHDNVHPPLPSFEEHNTHSLNMFLNNTDHTLFFILSHIIIKPYEANMTIRRKKNILDYHPTFDGAPLTCDITCCGDYYRFIELLKDALLLYPTSRARTARPRDRALTLINKKPKELTNEQFALKNILSFIKGIILKYMYEEFLEDKYDNFGADVAKANEDPRYEGLSIFEKSSRSSKKNEAKSTIKKYIRSKLSRKTRKNS